MVLGSCACPQVRRGGDGERDLETRGTLWIPMDFMVVEWWIPYGLPLKMGFDKGLMGFYGG